MVISTQRTFAELNILVHLCCDLIADDPKLIAEPQQTLTGSSADIGIPSFLIQPIKIRHHRSGTASKSIFGIAFCRLTAFSLITPERGTDIDFLHKLTFLHSFS